MIQALITKKIKRRINTHGDRTFKYVTEWCIFKDKEELNKKLFKYNWEVKEIIENA